MTYSIIKDPDFARNIAKQYFSPIMNQYKIHEVINYKNSNSGLVVVFESYSDRARNRNAVEEYLKTLSNVFEVVEPDNKSSENVTPTQIKFRSDVPLNFGDENFLFKTKDLKIRYKFKQATLVGIQYETILAFALSPYDSSGKKILHESVKKNLFSLLKTRNEESLEKLLKESYPELLDLANSAKEQLEEEYLGRDNISSTESWGGKSGKIDVLINLLRPVNSKTKLGISSKFSETGDNSFESNIDLGDGAFTTTTFPVLDLNGNPISLIKSPEKNMPWWAILRRKLALEALQLEELSPHYKEIQEYYEYLGNPPRTFESKKDYNCRPPEWMVRNFSNTSKYKFITEQVSLEVFNEIRSTLIQNLKKLNRKQLVSFVNFYRFGKRTEEEKEIPLVKLYSYQTNKDKKNITIKPVQEEIPSRYQDPNTPILSVSGRNITISITGLEPVLIQGVKFRGANPFTHNRNDLNIKIR